MKKWSLSAILLFSALGLSFGIVFAQDAPPEPSAGVAFDYNRDRLQYEGQSVISELSGAAALPPVPFEPLMPCPAEVTAATVCDRIATSAEDMVGVWSVYFNAEPAFLRFNADGTWVTGDTAESTSAASVEGYPAGSSSFDEAGVWSTLDTTLPECQSGRYLVRVILVGGQPVALNLALIEDCFPPRQSDYGYTLLRVSGE